MTLTFLSIYNKITGQAWSMFDGDVEDKEEFETSVTTSIQKALSALWNSYKWDFREKTSTFTTRENKQDYSKPNGNIVKTVLNNESVYRVKCDGKFLKYDPDCESKEAENNTPEYFYFRGDNIYLFPIPDDNYKITIDYLDFNCACSEDGEEKANLEDDTDYINISEKYEDLFLNTLMPFAMMYLIAEQGNENYSDYKRQYDVAFKILTDFCMGAEIDKQIGWR